MRIAILSCILFILSTRIFGQESIANRITKSEEILHSLQNDREAILRELEDLKLEQLRFDLVEHGLPQLLAGEEIISHAAMSLVYNEKMEQASWVAHIILPDVVNGMVGRSNDFRPDTLVKTGTAVDADYFLRDTLADGSIKYDGFGFDRGHLAPSADFRWSNKALSESFYYSNMSPQVADFNRNSWAKLEDLMRAYVQENNVALYIVTGPLLRENLPRIERGKNKLAIPVYYVPDIHCYPPDIHGFFEGTENENNKRKNAHVVAVYFFRRWPIANARASLCGTLVSN